MSGTLKIPDSQESEPEKIPKLLKRLDEIKRRIYLGGECDREALEEFTRDLKETCGDLRLSIYVDATILELEGRLMDRKGNYEKAKRKYLEAAEKLLQEAELTSTDLIAKSILLKATRSLEEARGAYARLKSHLEGEQRIGHIEYLIQKVSTVIYPTAKVEISKSYEKESSACGKIVLKLVGMGKTKIAFRMVKYSNLKRVEISNDILNIAFNLANKGEKEKAIKIIEAVYDNAYSICHLGEKWRVLIKIAIRCDEIESKVTRRIEAEIFNTFCSVSDNHGAITFQPLEVVLTELIENGNIEKAKKTTVKIFQALEKKEDICAAICLDSVAMKFAEAGAVKEAFETARFIEDPNSKWPTLNGVIRELVGKNVSAEEILKGARSSSDREINPNVLQKLALKFADEGNIDKALEIAFSIKRPPTRVIALLEIAQVLESISEAVAVDVVAGLGDKVKGISMDEIRNIEKLRVQGIIEEAVNTARSADSFQRSRLLSDCALVLSWIGEEEKATEIMNEAIDTAFSIKSSQSLGHIVSQLVQMDKIKKAFVIAQSIEDPKEKAFALVKIIPKLTKIKEVKEEVIKESKKSIEEAILQGMDFGSTYDLVKIILEMEQKIDLSEHSREAEETGLFLKGQKEHPAKVAIELGWVFKNLLLARSLYAKAGSDKRVKEVDERLKWMGRFSPLDIRPLEEAEMNLFVEREELRQLDTNIAIRNGGSIAICGERGSGKSTLVNNYLSKYKNDLDYLVIKMECSTYYDSCEFMRFLFQKVIEAIKSSGKFKELKKEERKRIVNLNERLKFIVSREKGFEAGGGLNIFLANIHAKASRKKSLTTYEFNHPQIITTIKNILAEPGANFSRIFIIIDEFDKLDVGAEEDFKRIKYRILQDLRAIFSIEGVYFILIGLEKHFQFEVKGEKAIEDSAFDDIIHLKLDSEEAHHFLSEILERRLNWLNLNELFDESGKEEMVKGAKGSPRELIRLLSKAIAYWVDKGVYRFDQKTVEGLV